MRKLLLATIVIAALAILASCQRSVSESERGISDSQATHPWQLPSGQQDWTRSMAGAEQAREIPPDGAVDLPLARGPQFSGTDTIDVGLLPGSWVMVGMVANERLDLRSNTAYSTLVLQRNGMFRLFIYEEGELARSLDGNWQKTEPGVITLVQTDQSGRAQPVAMYSEMFGTDFLYMWNYGDHRGYWYARQTMDEPYQQIEYNRYDSNLGKILLSNVGQQSYYGELTTPEGTVWQLNGYLVDGILNMAWIDSDNNASGFAAFIVEENWDRLRGVYWKNDYEAAPFTDEWLAEADR